MFRLAVYHCFDFLRVLIYSKEILCLTITFQSLVFHVRTKVDCFFFRTVEVQQKHDGDVFEKESYK